MKQQRVIGIVKFLIGCVDSLEKSIDKELLNKLCADTDCVTIRNLCTIRSEILKCQIVTNKRVLLNETMVHYLGLTYNGTIQEVLSEINKEIRNSLDRLNKLDGVVPSLISSQLLTELLCVDESDTGSLESLIVYFIKNKNYYPEEMFFNFYCRDSVDIFKSDTVFLNSVSVLTKPGVCNEILNKFIDNSSGICIIVDCENTDVFKFYGFLKVFRPDQLKMVKKISLINDTRHLQSSWFLMKDFPAGLIEYVDVNRIVKSKSRVDLVLTIMTCKYSYSYGIRDIIIVSSDSDYTALYEEIMTANFLVIYDQNKWSDKVKKFCDLHLIKSIDINQFLPSTIDAIVDRVVTSELNEILSRDYTISLSSIIDEASKQCSLSNRDITAVITSKLKDLRLHTTDTEIVPFVERGIL